MVNRVSTTTLGLCLISLAPPSSGGGYLECWLGPLMENVVEVDQPTRGKKSSPISAGWKDLTLGLKPHKIRQNGLPCATLLHVHARSSRMSEPSLFPPHQLGIKSFVRFARKRRAPSLPLNGAVVQRYFHTPVPSMGCPSG